MRTIETTVYTFDELSERAKERARDWFRNGIQTDDYAEDVISDAAQCGAILGITFRTRSVQLMGGGTRYDPRIYWSGFSAQGDGACFEGSYTYAKDAAQKIREHAPLDTRLHAIADTLETVQSRNGYSLAATTQQRGHYQHSGCMSVETERTDEGPLSEDAADTVRDTLRAFADWIYHQLKEEYEYRTSDEAVDEDIRANEYEFTADGERA